MNSLSWPGSGGVGRGHFSGAGMSSLQDTPAWIYATGPMPDPQPRSKGSLPLLHRWVDLEGSATRYVGREEGLSARPPPTGCGARCWLLGPVCPRGQHPQVLAPNCSECEFPAALGTSAQSLGSGRVNRPPLRPPQGPLVVTGSARHQGHRLAGVLSCVGASLGLRAL